MSRIDIDEKELRARRSLLGASYPRLQRFIPEPQQRLIARVKRKGYF